MKIRTPFHVQGLSGRSLFLVLALLAFTLLGATSSHAQLNQRLHNYGKYKVGFKYGWVTNYSRNNCGEIGTSDPGKQVLIGIWYPATSTGKKIMKLNDYMMMNGLKGNEPIVASMRDYSRHSWFSYSLMEYEDSTYEAKELAFSGAMDFSTYAGFEAPVMKGKYPVVLYHHGAGGTYDDNVLMCEYLASHGFVVISSALLHCSRETVFEDFDWRENTSDLDAILGAIAQMPNADINRVALMGHSRGCQFGYAAILGRSSPYKCFIGLDPTWDGKPFDDLYKDWWEPSLLRYLKENNTRVITPILHIASFRENSGIPEDSARVLNEQGIMQLPVTELFMHSDRHTLTLDQEVSHETYISQSGYDFLRMLPHLKDPDDVAYAEFQLKYYHFISETILHYLSMQLLPSEKTKQVWEQFTATMSLVDENAVYRKFPGKPVPTLEDEWPAILRSQGMDSVTAILTREMEQSGYHQFVHESLAQHFFHENRALAKQIVEQYKTMWPDSWKGPYLEGTFAFNEGREEDAHQFYDEALKRSPPDYIVDFLKDYTYYIW